MQSLQDWMNPNALTTTFHNSIRMSILWPYRPATEPPRVGTVTSTQSINGNAAAVAGNLRRIMARDDLTFEQVVAATELDERTLRSLARGVSHPHARTLHKLAQGLGVSIDELFQPVGRTAPRRFD